MRRASSYAAADTPSASVLAAISTTIVAAVIHTTRCVRRSAIGLLRSKTWLCELSSESFMSTKSDDGLVWLSARRQFHDVRVAMKHAVERRQNKQCQ